jgi:hypothetical protein
MEEEENEKKLDKNPIDNNNNRDDSQKQAEGSPTSPGTSSYIDKLHGGLSRLLKTATPNASRSVVPEPPSEVKLTSASATSPTTKIETPSPEILKTPLEMFHERIEKLNEGLPEGLLLLFTDAKELDEDSIVINALED